MALAGGVFDQDHLSRADDPLLTVARGDFHAGVEVDDVLPARRRMPIEVVVAGSLAEDDARGRQAPGELAARQIMRPFDLDIAEVRCTRGVGIEVVDVHGSLSQRPRTATLEGLTGCAYS